MEEGRKKKRDRRRDRAEGKEFMDAAREAFVRYMALEKWREVEDMRETLGFDWAQAAKEAGQFPGRGSYHRLWVRRWEEDVLPQATGTDPGKLFAALEAAITAAVRDEEEERKARGDRPLDEEPEYKGFLDAALGKLYREAAGELEPG
ncbi:MAG: hypothetical protein HY726_22810 [Candidatus Rokubacteria bacterium]|nr:hypothetical protein [Candidatus Rokubacteria bacterium]